MYNSQYTYSNPYYNQFNQPPTENDETKQIQTFEMKPIETQIRTVSVNDFFDKDEDYKIPPSVEMIPDQSEQTTYTIPSNKGFSPFPTISMEKKKIESMTSSTTIPITNVPLLIPPEDVTKKQSTYKVINPYQPSKSSNQSYSYIPSQKPQQVNTKTQDRLSPILKSIPTLKDDDLVVVTVIKDPTIQGNYGNDNSSSYPQKKLDEEESIEIINHQQLREQERRNDEANTSVIKKLFLMGLLFFPLYLIIAYVFKESTDKRIMLSRCLFILGSLISILFFLLSSFNIL